MSRAEQHVTAMFEQAAQAGDHEKRDGDPAEIVFGPNVNDADQWEIIQLLQQHCQVDVLRRGEVADTAVYAVEPRAGGDD